MKRRLFRSLAVFSLGVISIFGTGCESLIMAKPKAPENVEGLRISSEQLRVRMRVLVNPLTGIVQGAADEIIAASDDPEVRRAALEWKAAAIPAIRESLYSPHPVVAFLDIWALSYQMIHYFETGRGTNMLKSYAPVALAASLEINGYLEDLADNLVADLSDVEKRNRAEALLEDWATENPITGSIGSRESINNQVTEISIALGFSLGEAVDAMVTTVDDLNRKLEVYSDQIPAQARWQAELFAMDALEELKLRESVEKMPVLMDTAIAALETAQTAPTMVASEREIVLEALRVEIAFALETLQFERQMVMKQLSLERELILADIAANRIALTQDLRSEREAIEAMVARERVIILDETEELRGRLISDLFWRLVIILGLIGLYLAILVLAILWFLNRRPWGKEQGGKRQG